LLRPEQDEFGMHPKIKFFILLTVGEYKGCNALAEVPPPALHLLVTLFVLILL
jgi:hypothetical protein